jgi:putative solute:sodium symporter small subunit
MSSETSDLDGTTTSDPRVRACIARYWRRNVTLMSGLLFVWAAVSLGCGVLFVEPLNTLRIGGYPLGFWFAQQGSILVFVVLILVYALRMTRLDRDHHAELLALAKDPSGEAIEPR